MRSGNLTKDTQVTVSSTAAAMSRDSSSFTDEAAISDWAREAMGRGIEAGLITGHPDGSIRSRDCTTRAEAAAVFSRFMESYVKCDQYGSLENIEKTG